MSQPRPRGTLDRHAPGPFEQVFINGLAVLILDPSRDSLTPLVRDIRKRPIQVVRFGFDYPSRHGITQQE